MTTNTAHTEKYHSLGSYFPKRILNYRGMAGVHGALRYLVHEYTEREISFPRNQLTAIASLEERLSETLKGKSRYFMVERSLHRQLL